MTRAKLPHCACVVLACMAPIAAYADEADLLRRIEEQQRTIDAQNARIERLEVLLEQVLEDRQPVAVPPPSSAAPPPQTASQTQPAAAPAVPPAEAAKTFESDPFTGAQKSKGYDPERAFFGPLPRLRSSDGDFSLGFSGLLQFDGAIHSQGAQGDNDTTQSLSPDLSDGTRVRRAIIGVNGVFLDDWIYALFYDLADTDEGVDEGLRSALAIYRGLDPFWLIIGQQNIAAGMDSSTFSSRRMFVEAAMPIGSFGFAPGTPSMGVSMLHRGPNHNFRLGYYGSRTDIDSNGDEGHGVHGRFVWAPIAERTRAVHLGMSGYFRQPNLVRGINNIANQTSVSFSSRPEINVDDVVVVDTGTIPRADNYYFVGLEAATVYGPWSLQGEYGYVGVNRETKGNDVPFQDLKFDGYYLQGSYFLTGESRNYYTRVGSFWRVAPKQNFSLSTGGWGAWEVAMRYSFLDLDDGVDNLAGGGIRGGVAENWTFGINWYLNPFVRAQFNYVHADVDNLSNTGLSEGTVADIFALRFQIEW